MELKPNPGHPGSAVLTIPSDSYTYSLRVDAPSNAAPEGQVKDQNKSTTMATIPSSAAEHSETKDTAQLNVRIKELGKIKCVATA